MTWRGCFMVGVVFNLSCGQLSPLRRDGGPSNTGGGLAPETGGGVANAGGGNGTGGGGSTQNDLDAGWSVTPLPATAFDEFVLPGFPFDSAASLAVWNGQLYYTDSTGVLWVANQTGWSLVNDSLATNVMALRAVGDGPLLLTDSRNQYLCAGGCLDGGTPQLFSLPEGAWPDRGCTGNGPPLLKERYQHLFAFADAGWADAGWVGFAASRGACHRLASGDVLIGDDDRISRLSPDGSYRHETPVGWFLPIVDFAQPSFGVVAVAFLTNELLRENDGGWQSLARPPGRDWLRAFALTDGGLLIVGSDALTLVSDGKLGRWPLSRGSMLVPQPDSITFDAAHQTVWVVAQFKDKLGDNQNLVVGFRPAY